MLSQRWKKNAETKRRADKVADRQRKIVPEEKRRGWGRLQRGNSSEESCRQRAEYRGKTLETEAGRALREGAKERIENEGLIVNGWVVLKHPKMYVGMEKREGVCVCVCMGNNSSD